MPAVQVFQLHIEHRRLHGGEAEHAADHLVVIGMAAAVDAEFFEGTSLRSLLVVNLGHPGEDAWYDRLPRLEHDEVVRSV